MVYHCGGTEIDLFHKPEGIKAEHTALSFRMNDIRAAIGELSRSRLTRPVCWAVKEGVAAPSARPPPG
ncbi:hypothetical protein, partial [Paracoccus acridae]|uniref:hypothetical protein n=1 Tax=Paracoccus acridae TaxID=1795310 RepID=UPI001E6065A3